ncbi:MAG: hypothetical protein ACKO1J_16800, partial [Tagaea sp.]
MQCRRVAATHRRKRCSGSPERKCFMSNSINTNVGAMVALASLRTTQSALNVASKQVQTGYRVADAQDDAST